MALSLVLAQFPGHAQVQGFQPSVSTVYRLAQVR
jgi:hypothetical protein